MFEQNTNPNMNMEPSDEALDALLAQWAETEIEPPADFHQNVMSRLRQETVKPAGRQNNVIPLFVAHKKWVAAAAVVALCCIPVLHGLPGSKSEEPQAELAMATESLYDSHEAAPAESDNLLVEAPATDVQSNPEEKAPAGGILSQVTQKIGGTKKDTAPAEKQQVIVAPADTASPIQIAATRGAAAPEPAAEQEEAATPMMAAAGPEDGIAVMSVEEDENAQPEQNVSVAPMNADTYRRALEDLQQQLNDGQAALEATLKLLEQDPENSDLKKLATDQTQVVNTLKKEVERMQKLLDEAISQQRAAQQEPAPATAE